MKHTPTPWKAEGTNIYAQAPANVRPHIAKVIYGDSQDAAFIVRACNSHDALVSALKTANHVLGILLQSDSGTYTEAQEQIKSALSLAK